ncbi:hypothetical protein BGZ97_000009 [Linnemannia gamsii]|uniref:Uncharacterized protein n=1 Tax=Linnemannia gamsii TaxID=64522 RepID=A0A9P6UX53_9FUNG|nr:hypothetical protein BGZ97_000009 [Linnemannia gamsii]
MPDTIKFTIPGEPVAKGRARALVRKGRIAHYTPKKTVQYESLVRLVAQQAMSEKLPAEGAISLIIRAFLSIPKSWNFKKREAAVIGAIAHTQRPDLDNIVKAIKDGANGVAWRDDSQVIHVQASKQYGMPRVEVEMTIALSGMPTPHKK